MKKTCHYLKVSRNNVCFYAKGIGTKLFRTDSYGVDVVE